MLVYLEANADLVAGFFRRNIGGIRVAKPEATYLGWLNCSQLPIAGTAFDFFHDRAKIGFSAGETFDPTAAKFVRFNFATSERIMDRILERMIAAVRQSNAPAS